MHFELNNFVDAPRGSDALDGDPSSVDGDPSMLWMAMLTIDPVWQLAMYLL